MSSPVKAADQTVDNQTIWTIVRASVNRDQLRIRLVNTFGPDLFSVGGVMVEKRDEDPAVDSDSLQELRVRVSVRLGSNPTDTLGRPPPFLDHLA